jgi:hypothetical protein
MGTTWNVNERAYHLTPAQRDYVREETGDWQGRALCAGSLAFLALSREDQDLICARCPVRDECIEYELYAVNDGRRPPRKAPSGDLFPCAHPRTAENTVRNGHRSNGQPIITCRDCAQKRRRNSGLQSKSGHRRMVAGL